MSKKKKIRNILLIVVGVFVLLFIYGKHNFENDKQSLLEIKTSIANGDLQSALDKMEKTERFSNPIINTAYQKWKTEIEARFITKEEVIENTSGNKIVNDISTIYRNYWRTELLKANSQDRTDSTLYKMLIQYIVTNELSNLTIDSLSQNIKNDSELTRIIEAEGFKTKFMYRNGFQDLFIWGTETRNNYEVTLPKDTVNATVVFIENYHLNGYDNYASVGSSEVGGWAVKESATLYCNKNSYDLTSELFRVSYLKHESLHFVDLNEYPNLSSADLEYRAKVIELMYCTEETVYDRITQFTTGADSSDRSHSHPYANYCLIKDLSRLLFDSDYETDHNKWNKLTAESINLAAAELYKKSEESLLVDKNMIELI